MSGFPGSTRIVAICPTSRSPLNAHVFPASVDFQMPRPIDTLLRIFDDPVPAYTTSGFDCDTSIAPIDPSGRYASVTFTHVCPASVVFHTPPPVEPI